MAAETRARAAGLGIWGDTYYTVRRADRPAELAKLAGHYELVEGRVLNAEKLGAQVFLNFGRYYKEDFTAVIDARAPEFYNGEKPGIEGAVPGHVPGAHNLPFTSISGPDGKVKSPEELQALFTAAGVKSGDHVIAYCHIGIQATAVIFAARTLGIDAQLYDGSFQDWSMRQLPTESSRKGS